MKRFTQQFKKQAEAVKLSASEREDLRERLQSYLEYHPLPKETAARPATPIRTEPFSIVTLSWRRFLPLGVGAFAIVLAIVPVLAERSVPGDTLYAVKVGFNEEVRGTLTFDSVERVEWETERLNRRIAEARLLASEGRLTPAMEADVAEAVRTHNDNAQREIAELREQDADEAAIASITLDAVLDAQASAFAEVAEREIAASQVASGEENATAAAQSAPSSTSTGAVASAPESSDEEANLSNLIADAINDSRSQNQVVDASSTPSYGKLMAKVEQNTTRIYELRRTVEPYLGEARTAEVDRRIADTERAVADAIAQATTDEASARTKLIDVLQRTQRLIVYLTELELSSVVDLERLVPKVLTDEEKQGELERYFADLEEYGGIIESRLAVAELSADEREKIDRLQTQSNELLTQIDATTDPDEKLRLVVEARGLLNDAVLMLEAKESGPVETATSTPDVADTATSTPSTEEPASVSATSTTTPPVDPAVPTTTPTTTAPGAAAGSATATAATAIASTSAELGISVDTN